MRIRPGAGTITPPARRRSPRSSSTTLSPGQPADGLFPAAEQRPLRLLLHRLCAARAAARAVCGRAGRLSVCTREQAKDQNNMPTYDECYNQFVARGDYENNARLQFRFTPSPFNMDTSVAKGWCFLLGVDDFGALRGDVSFFHKNSYVDNIVSCLARQWGCPCASAGCRARLPPPPGPPHPPTVPGSCSNLVKLIGTRIPVSEFGENKVFCHSLGSVVNCNMAYRWKNEHKTEIQLCKYVTASGGSCDFDEYDAGAVCNFPPSAPPPSPLPPNAPYEGSCPEVRPSSTRAPRSRSSQIPRAFAPKSATLPSARRPTSTSPRRSCAPATSNPMASVARRPTWRAPARRHRRRRRRRGRRRRRRRRRPRRLRRCCRPSTLRRPRSRSFRAVRCPTALPGPFATRRAATAASTRGTSTSRR